MPKSTTIMQKTLTVRYFAMLKESAGTDCETVKTQAATLAELYDELKSRHAFAIAAKSLRVAVDDCFVPMESPVKEGSEVIFVPPVAGG